MFECGNDSSSANVGAVRRSLLDDVVLLWSLFWMIKMLSNVFLVLFDLCCRLIVFSCFHIFSDVDG